MAGNQVGFAFQADVIAGGSILSNMSMRLFKSLMDADIHAYALSAAMDIGKMIPLPEERELSIVTALRSLPVTRHSVLSAVLNIGFGQTDIAMEVSKTKDGCAALITFHAFACGGVSTWDAATALRHLLLNFGAPTDIAPSIASLENVVKYVFPLLRMCSFEAVFQQVLQTVISKAKNDRDLLQACNSRGNPKDYASVVYQLSFTAREKGTFYLYARQKASWIAAFASYALGMSVELGYKGSVLWKAAGAQGTLFIEADICDLSQSPSLVHSYSHRVKIVHLPESREFDSLSAALCRPGETFRQILARHALLEDSTTDLNIDCNDAGNTRSCSCGMLFVKAVASVTAARIWILIDCDRNREWSEKKHCLQAICSVLGIPDVYDDFPYKYAESWCFEDIMILFKPGFNYSLSISPLRLQEVPKCFSSCCNRIFLRRASSARAFDRSINGLAAAAFVLISFDFEPSDIALNVRTISSEMNEMRMKNFLRC